MTFLHLFSINGHIILHQNRYADNETYYHPYSLQRELVSNWNQRGNEVSPDWRMTFPWNTTWGTLGCRTSQTRALKYKGHPCECLIVPRYIESCHFYSIQPLQKWKGSHFNESHLDNSSLTMEHMLLTIILSQKYADTSWSSVDLNWCALHCSL